MVNDKREEQNKTLKYCYCWFKASLKCPFEQFTIGITKILYGREKLILPS